VADVIPGLDPAAPVADMAAAAGVAKLAAATVAIVAADVRIPRILNCAPS
jgi:hypothetical protein